MSAVHEHKQKELAIDLFMRGVGICIGDVYGDRLEAVEFIQEAHDIVNNINIEEFPISIQHQLVKQIKDFLDLIETNPLGDHDEQAMEIYHIAKGYRNGHP